MLDDKQTVVYVWGGWGVNYTDLHRHFPLIFKGYGYEVESFSWAISKELSLVFWKVLTFLPKVNFAS